jgi:dolichol-phosphate mannosyltransferase
LAPNSHYAVSKAAASHYLHFCGKQRQLPVVNLRLYSVYGPWEEPSRLVPSLVRSALAGTEVRLASPDSVRDFVAVEDVGRAFVQAAGRMDPALCGESFNIGTGVETAVRQVVDLLLPWAPDLAVVYGSGSGRAWEVNHWRADISKAQALLNWSPQIDLATGLARTVTWAKREGWPTPTEEKHD